MAEKENYFFRATEMKMVEMFLSQECAYECVKELGELVSFYMPTKFDLKAIDKYFTYKEIQQKEITSKHC